MDIESLEHHIRTLDNQHTALEGQIQKMLNQKSWSEYELEDLKKKKLKLKDELSVCYRKRHELMQEHHWD
jgi:hypothetical protein